MCVYVCVCVCVCVGVGVRVCVLYIWENVNSVVKFVCYVHTTATLGFILRWNYCEVGVVIPCAHIV